MSKSIPALCAALLLSAAATVSAADTGTIEVVVTDLQSADGQILISLYDKGEGFPTKEDNIIEQVAVKPEGDTATGSFEGLPYGTYAVVAHHDEDGNGKMKTVYGTMPIEGLGVSNDAQGRFGPPKFDDAKFELNSDSYTAKIKMAY